jgi:putative ATP-dependent endonuclease of OLD family
MMDVTRASMYFAKGLILVEGVCEALLIPALAERLGFDLAKDHVAVVPVCGVAFETFKKLLGPAGLGIRTAIVTDADPPVAGGQRWQDMQPSKEYGAYALSPRTKKLIESFAEHPTVRVHHSTVTLEYDLAEAGEENARFMAEAWARGFEGKPRTLTKDMVTKPDQPLEDRALAVWRGVCQANSTGRKAELAQRLAEMLLEQDGCPGFVVPTYIVGAIGHVVADVTSPPTATASLDRADANV